MGRSEVKPPHRSLGHVGLPARIASAGILAVTILLLPVVVSGAVSAPASTSPRGEAGVQHRTTPLPVAPARDQWREAAGIAVRPVFEPMALFGLTEHDSYVPVFTPNSSYPTCHVVNVVFAAGRAHMYVAEVTNPQECGGNIGDQKLVRRVAIGTSTASLFECNGCAHPTPDLLVWAAMGTSLQLDWTSVRVATAIDFARDMRLVKRPAAIRPSQPEGAAETTDANYVLSHNAGCYGYPKCPLVFQTAADGQGGTLVAVDLLAVGPTACSAFGVTFFFDGTAYLTSTLSLAPTRGVWAGSRPIWAAGTAEFGVNYPVTPGSGGPCSSYGANGVDQYVYRYNGSTMVPIAGRAPLKPQVLS